MLEVELQVTQDRVLSLFICIKISSGYVKSMVSSMMLHHTSRNLWNTSD